MLVLGPHFSSSMTRGCVSTLAAREIAEQIEHASSTLMAEAACRALISCSIVFSAFLLASADDAFTLELAEFRGDDGALTFP